MTVFLDNILQLFSEHSRKIATGVSIILIILMSLSVADTVLLVMETMNPPAAVPDSPRQSGASRQTYRISDLELFGKAQEKSTAAEVIDAPETRLNLELQGVFISEDPDSSTAIIAQKSQTGELYLIGDRLPGNAVLSAVHDDHVLLRRNGRIEKLMFSDSQFRVARSSAGSAAPSASFPAASNRSRLEQVRDRIRGVPSGPAAEGASSATSEQVEQVRRRLMQDPAGTLAESGITAVAEGQSRGYRIGSDSPAMVTQSGLQPGDVILSVNGRPVGSATSDRALVNQVMSASRVRVEVQRGQRRFFLTVPVPK